MELPKDGCVRLRNLRLAAQRFSTYKYEIDRERRVSLDHERIVFVGEILCDIPSDGIVEVVKVQKV